jgi:filamentous hemagglutinin family protein
LPVARPITLLTGRDFSIANGETVQFDTNNYLNLVRGASKSEINGALNGTGNIYLINPNGILFGATAQVNVGNLVASTRAIDKVDADGFAANGTNPLATAVKAATGDIVNLGKLQSGQRGTGRQ